MTEVTCVWREKKFDGGGTAQVIPLMYGRARIIVFRDWTFVDDMW